MARILVPLLVVLMGGWLYRQEDATKQFLTNNSVVTFHLLKLVYMHILFMDVIISTYTRVCSLQVLHTNFRLVLI
jgi:hypothetical protein